MDNATFVLGAVGTFLGAFALLAVSHLAVSRLLPRTRTSVRLTGAVTVAIGTYGVVFYTLVSLGLFEPLSLGLLLTLSMLGVAISSLRNGGADPSVIELVTEDAERGLESARWLYTGHRRWLSVPVTVLVGANLIRSAVIPPLAWDSLTYHLVRAALWIRDTGLSDYDAPGAWQDYQALMPLGDALSAGFMILPSSDALVPFLWFGVWGFFGLSVYAAGRCLGADRTGASLGATAACLVPAVSGGMFVAYVDNLVGALALAAFALFMAELRSTRGWAAGVAMLALGAALATKKTALPFVAAGFCALIAQIIALDDNRARRIFVGAGAFVLVAGPPMAYIWASHGSPFHPWAIDPAGWTAHLSDLFKTSVGSGRATGTPVESGEPNWTWFRYLMFEGYGDMFPLSHLGYGPMSPLLAAMGLAGLGFSSLERRSWLKILVSAAFVGAGLVMIVAVIQYPKLDPNLARYSVGAIGLMGVGCACFRVRWARLLIFAVILVQWAYLLPLNWGPADAQATLYWLVSSTPFVVISSLIVFWAKDQSGVRRLVAMLAGGLFLVIGSLATLEPVRHEFRYDIYREASQGLSYSNHPLVGADSYESTNLWKALERQRHVKTAVTVGWALSGLNWYVYPFFGARLQNGITYVPVTKDGTLMPLREKRQRTGKASYEAWRRRLEARGVRFVAALAPRPVEVHAMQVHTDAFELVAQGPHPENRLYRVVYEER